MNALRAMRRELPEIAGRQFFATPVITQRPPEGFVADHRWTVQDGIGLAMARMPRHGTGPVVHRPRALDHQDIGRAPWFVGESDAQRVADTIEKSPWRHGVPHARAAPGGAAGEAARSTEDAHPAPPVPDGAGPVSEAWRRRIAEESAHQEGVSL
ncbi:hypothetical protein ACWEFJ_37060 [Actinosynnema sp. NPDC004786]